MWIWKALDHLSNSKHVSFHWQSRCFRCLQNVYTTDLINYQSLPAGARAFLAACFELPWLSYVFLLLMSQVLGLRIRLSLSNLMICTVISTFPLRIYRILRITFRIQTVHSVGLLERFGCWWRPPTIGGSFALADGEGKHWHCADETGARAAWGRGRKRSGGKKTWQKERGAKDKVTRCSCVHCHGIKRCRIDGFPKLSSGMERCNGCGPLQHHVRSNHFYAFWLVFFS